MIYPKMMFFRIFLFLLKTIYPKHNLPHSTFFLRGEGAGGGGVVKGTQIWPEKEVNPFRG